MMPPSHCTLLIFVSAAQSFVAEAARQSASWRLWWEHGKNWSFWCSEKQCQINPLLTYFWESQQIVSVLPVYLLRRFSICICEIFLKTNIARYFSSTNLNLGKLSYESFFPDPWRVKYVRSLWLEDHMDVATPLWTLASICSICPQVQKSQCY